MKTQTLRRTPNQRKKAKKIFYVKKAEESFKKGKEKVIGEKQKAY